MCFSPVKNLWDVSVWEKQNGDEVDVYEDLHTLWVDKLQRVGNDPAGVPRTSRGPHSSPRFANENTSSKGLEMTLRERREQPGIKLVPSCRQRESELVPDGRTTGQYLDYVFGFWSVARSLHFRKITMASKYFMVLNDFTKCCWARSNILWEAKPELGAPRGLQTLKLNILLQKKPELGLRGKFINVFKYWFETCLSVA